MTLAACIVLLVPRVLALFPLVGDKDKGEEEEEEAVVVVVVVLVVWVCEGCGFARRTRTLGACAGEARLNAG
jgi:hypothetical protein